MYVSVLLSQREGLKPETLAYVKGADPMVSLRGASQKSSSAEGLHNRPLLFM